MCNSIARVNFNLDFIKITFLSNRFADSACNFHEIIVKLGWHKQNSVYIKKKSLKVEIDSVSLCKS